VSLAVNEVGDEQARAKAASAGHSASWKNRFQARAMISTNRRDLFSSSVIFVNSNDSNGHAPKKGNERAIMIPIGSKQGHYVTLCAA